MLYYNIKYPFSYGIINQHSQLCLMFSIPVKDLVDMYKIRMNKPPKSFFDCGAATGILMRQAENIGMTAQGIDIQAYPDVSVMSILGGLMPEMVTPLQKKNIQIVSLLDYDKPIDADLAYCNGTLTYFDEKNIRHALSKLSRAKMLIAIHNTTHDICAARKSGEELLHGEPRLIKPVNWWLKQFRKAGFNVDYDEKFGCFCAISERCGVFNKAMENHIAAKNAIDKHTANMV